MFAQRQPIQLKRRGVQLPRRRSGLRATLFDGLVSWWPLGEATGNPRIDTYGPNDLTPVNDPENAGGLIGDGVHCTIVDSEHLSSDSDDFAGGNVSFTLAGVWLADANVANQSIFGTSDAKLWLRLSGAPGTTATLRLNDGSDIETAASCLAAGSINTFFAGYDAATQLQYLQINNGAIQTTANTVGFALNAARTFYLGAHTGPGFFYGGLLDEFGLWIGRFLGGGERTWIHNAGAWRTLSDFGSYLV